MSYLESNSTHTPLLANQFFIGRAEIVNPIYITIQISFRTDVSGTLEVYHSFDGSSFSTYGDSFNYSVGGNRHKQVAIKGSYIYVKYINGNSNQSYFDLHCKLAETVREEMEVSLNSLDDSVSIPKLEQCISNNALSVTLGSVSEVLCYGRNANGDNKILRLANDDRLKVDISGVYSNLGLKVDISGQYLRADLSGSNVNDVIAQQRLLLIHNDVSGVDSRLLTLHNDSVNIHNDVSGVDSRLVTLHNDSVIIHNDVSGVDSRLLTIHNDVSGVSNSLDNIYNMSMTIHNDVSGVDSRLVTLHNDSVTIHNDVSGFRFLGDYLKVDVSGQCIKLNPLDLSGVSVNIATVNAGANIGARVMGLTGTTYEDIKTDGHKHLLMSITDSGETKFTTFNTDGGLNTHCMNLADISGSRVDISGQSVRITSMPPFSVTADISGQTVRVSNLLDLSGVNVRVSNLADISGSRVDISGQTVRVNNLLDLSGVNVRINNTNDLSGVNVRGYDGTTYNNLFVDADGFITANTLTAVHDNILLGFDNNYADYCAGSTNVGIWSKDNPYASSQDGWYCSTDANTNDVSIYTYLNHYFGGYNQSDFTYNDIDTWYSIIQNWNCVNLNTMPQVRVYSATSMWEYTINPGTSINNGEQVMIYFGLLSRVKANDVECRRIHYTLTGGTGTRAGTEVITKIELWIPATIGEYINMNVIEGAVYVKNKGLINYYYTNDKVGREQNDIRAIKTNSDKFNFLSNKLLVDVSGQRADISGQTITTKGLWLDTETQHLNNPASLGNPNIIKSADGAMSSYINGAGYSYSMTDNKLGAGNMLPVNVLQTNINSTAETYQISLCTKDKDLYDYLGSRYDTAGVVMAGWYNGNTKKKLSATVDGKLMVDVSGQGVLANAYSRTDATNKVVTCVQPTGTSTSNIRALETYAYNVCLNNSSNLNLPITSTSTPTTQSMDVFVNNNSTTNNYDISGLNMYQIYPKRKTYSMKGTTFNNTYNNILGGYYSASDFLNINVTNKVWYYRFTNATTITSALYGDYIDAIGNLQEDKLLANMTSSSGTTTFTALLGGVAIKNINSWRMNPNPTVSSTMDICNGNTQATSLGGFYYNIGAVSSVNLSLCGMFCVPNGYIAWITGLGTTNTGNFNFGVIYADGTRKLLGGYYCQTGTSKEILSGGGNYNGIGGTFTAGDRIFLVGGDAGTGQRWGYFDIVMEQI